MIAVGRSMSKERFFSLALAVLAAAMAGRTVSGGTTAPARGGPAASRPATRPAAARPLRVPREQMRELTAFLEEYLPDSYGRIQRLQRDNPRQARRHWSRVYRLWWRVRHYPPDVRQAAVTCYRLNRSIYQAVREIGRADNPAEKAEVTERLRKLLGEHFDRDQVVKEYRVKHLARQLAELKARLAERRKGRAALIEKRLTELLKPPPASRPATTRPAPRRYLRRRPPLTPEREAALMQFVRESAPELLAQLERLRKDDPPEARKMLSRVHRLWRRVRGYPPNVRAAVLARRRLNVAIERAVQKIRSAEDRAERKRLIPALRKLLGEQFGHSQVFLEYRLTRLGRELEDLKAELAARRLDRSSIIAERLGRLLLPPRPPARVTSRD